MSVLRTLALSAVLVGVAPAYYHFVHYNSRVAPFRPILERFDINALPGRVLPYFISDPATLNLSSPEHGVALLSQVSAACKVWNDVDTSELRLTFGGFARNGSNQNGPSVEILFDTEVPGLIAMGGPTIRESAGSTVSTLKSVVLVNPNAVRRPIHSEEFFSTLVHEVGHAVGLQHTFTSGVMATSTTRTTSKARPLTTDDVAAISLLYPRPGFLPSTGSITGRVTMSGGGVNLASVVAIATNGAAVSTLTNPDGTYRIDGLPPRGYYVYVHPLPPPRPGQATPGDIVYPMDSDGRYLPESAPFETVFFNPGSPNGTKDWVQSTPVGVTAGSVVENISFSVRGRNGYTIHSVETYAYPGNSGVKPPYLSPSIRRPYVAATGLNLTAAATVSVLGGASLPVRPFPSAPDTFVQIDFAQQMLLVSSDSPRHLVFGSQNDIYVLPSAFFHVENQPPQIATVTSAVEGNTRIATIQATGVNADTRYLFDGTPAQVRSLETLPNGGGSRVTLTAPQAPPGHKAVVTALNSDGQSSLFLQNEAPPTMQYGGEGASALPAFITSPSSIPPGADAAIQIDAVGTQFVEGQVSVGFGSTDVVVKRIWVLSPTRLLVSVAAHPNAVAGVLPLTVLSGLQVLNSPFTFAVSAPAARPFWLASNYANAGTGGTSISAGSVVVLNVAAAPVNLTTSNTAVLLNETRITPLTVATGQVTFVVPQGMATGVTTLRLDVAGERSLPIPMVIDAQAARIVGANAAGGDPKPGDLVFLTVAGLGSAAAQEATVTIGGRDTRVIRVFPEADRHVLVVRVPEEMLRNSTVPVVLFLGGAPSEPFNLKVGG
ncbi:MAG TPA: matrixin family metalloprotease [Bryobacteraceae bacterium]|nr:matrixin family metalloprotease [Bryobacteraceae bacterium]